MSRHYVWYKGDWVEYVPVRGQKRAGPIIIRDTGAYRNIIDGKMIDGRTEHREFLKRNGVHEVGNDPVRERPQAPSYAETKQLREDIGKAYNMVAEGYKPEPTMTESEFKAIGE